MRLTRAARRAEAPLDNDASGTHPNTDERTPLGEVSLNAADLEPEVQEESKAMAPKRTKSKRGGKKSAKNNKPKVEEQDEPEQTQVVLEDERQLAGSPASDAAAEDLAAPPTEGTSFIFN